MKRAWLPICLLALAVTGCGIGTSDRVEEVDEDLLGGLEEQTTTTTTTAPPADGSVVTSTTAAGGSTTVVTEPITLYFIEGSQLRAVEDQIAVDARLRQRLRLLEEGPPPDLAEEGMRTAVVPGLISGTEAWGTDGVTVDLDGELFSGIDDADQLLVIGQIVMTITDRSDTERVNFTVDGEPIRVFRGDNALSEPGESVGRADYEVLLADPAAADSSSSTTDSSRSSVSLDTGP